MRKTVNNARKSRSAAQRRQGSSVTAESSWTDSANLDAPGPDWITQAAASQPELSDDLYRRLLALRSGLRRFQHWSEAQAKAAGLTPAQHQLLLAVRGNDDPAGPTISDLADSLLLRHHSVVGLVDRAEAAGLLRRKRDSEDHRAVRLKLTPLGERRLAALSALHVEELRRLAHQLPDLWEGLPDLPGADGEPQTD